MDSGVEIYIYGRCRNGMDGDGKEWAMGTYAVRRNPLANRQGDVFAERGGPTSLDRLAAKLSSN